MRRSWSGARVNWWVPTAKFNLVVSLERGTMEGGATPGNALPVFDCDFGKLGIQICYDMEFGDGWTGTGAQGRGTDRLAHTISADLSARIPREGESYYICLEHLAA